MKNNNQFARVGKITPHALYIETAEVKYTSGIEKINPKKPADSLVK